MQDRVCSLPFLLLWGGEIAVFVQLIKRTPVSKRKDQKQDSHNLIRNRELKKKNQNIRTKNKVCSAEKNFIAAYKIRSLRFGEE